MRLFFLLIALCSILNINAQTGGTLSGKVTDKETRESIPFINVVIKNTGLGGATNQAGEYRITGIPVGVNVVIVSGVGFNTVEEIIEVRGGENLVRNIELTATAIEVREVEVYGASLRRERITEAPSAVAVIDQAEIKRNGGHSQLPKLLENAPGVDIVQNGLFDFNINTRGFNSSLNRRLLILLDGRDLGTAFLGATEWNGLSTALEDLGRIEIIRGPGSALYGANAYNGVISISSLPPRMSTGTRIAAGIGEKNTYRLDIKNAGVVDQFSYRFSAGGFQGNSFSQSRVSATDFEYPLTFLNVEAVPIDLSPIRTVYGSGRVDYEISSNQVATLEGGYSVVENEIIVTGIGRVQIQKAARPWARLNYSNSGLNLLAWTNGRKNIEPEKSLSTGLELIQNAQITHVEGQYSFSSLGKKLVTTGGISQRFVSIDTEGTLMKDPRNDNMTGIFAQLEYSFTSSLKAVVAGRWDRSSLHKNEISPKVAIVYSPHANHTFRATFNKAFQPPNYSEQYLNVLHPVNALAYYGNDKLTPEHITGYEIGYKGVIENTFFITADVYFNQLDDFITDLAVGVNPNLPFSQVIGGRNRTIWSYGNAGKVNEGGIELGMNYYFSDHLVIDLNTTFFKFEVLEKHDNDYLIPNTPEYKINSGVRYLHEAGHSAEISFKYVPSYPWAAGIFRDSEIKSYTLVNLSGTYLFSSLLQFNLNIANLLDNKHYEILGGSILGRRAIITAILNL